MAFASGATTCPWSIRIPSPTTARRLPHTSQHTASVSLCAARGPVRCAPTPSVPRSGRRCPGPQSLHAFGVVAMHPVVQGLAGHPVRRCRLLPRRAFQDQPIARRRRTTAPSSVFPASARNADTDNSVRAIAIGWLIGGLPCKLWCLHRVNLQPTPEAPNSHRESRVTQAGINARPAKDTDGPELLPTRRQKSRPARYRS